MKKFALMTAIVAVSAVAAPAMADNNNWKQHMDSSAHRTVNYNNGNGYGKYKNGHHAKSKKYAKHHYTSNQGAYRHTATNAYHKWPVPTTPNNNPNHRHVMIGQHH